MSSPGQSQISDINGKQTAKVTILQLNMNKIIAIDFDGTIVLDKFPDIGDERPYAVNTIKLLKNRGYKVILWTCRTGEHFDAARKWLDERGLVFDAYNEHLPNEFEENGRKIHADAYIDDRSFPPFRGDWLEVMRNFK
jgi:histidinol phosphatase-like enzyme